MLTRSQRRQGQISNEQEGRDVTDEAPSVGGAGSEEPTTMSDGGEAVTSGSRSPHLSPLTGSESSEEVARTRGERLRHSTRGDRENQKAQIGQQGQKLIDARRNFRRRRMNNHIDSDEIRNWAVADLGATDIWRPCMPCFAPRGGQP